jgi:hypothetical protein
MSQDIHQTNEPTAKNGGIQFYGGYQVYSESGIDLTLLRRNLGLSPTERVERGLSAAAFANVLLEAGRASRAKQSIPNGGRPPMAQQVRLELILKDLAKQRVEYVLIGGQAMTLQGSAHVTFDLDLCYARTKENIAALAMALAPHHPYLRGAPPGLPFRFDPLTIQAGLNFTLQTDLGDIDVLGEVSGIGSYEQALAQSEEKTVFGQVVRVLSVDGLIAAKKAAGRVKDRNHILELEELKKMRDAAP